MSFLRSWLVFWVTLPLLLMQASSALASWARFFRWVQLRSMPTYLVLQHQAARPCAVQLGCQTHFSWINSMARSGPAGRV